MTNQQAVGDRGLPVVLLGSVKLSPIRLRKDRYEKLGLSVTQVPVASRSLGTAVSAKEKTVRGGETGETLTSRVGRDSEFHASGAYEGSTAPASSLISSPEASSTEGRVPPTTTTSSVKHEASEENIFDIYERRVVGQHENVLLDFDTSRGSQGGSCPSGDTEQVLELLDF